MPFLPDPSQERYALTSVAWARSALGRGSGGRGTLLPGNLYFKVIPVFYHFNFNFDYVAILYGLTLVVTHQQSLPHTLHIL